tara:strand:- start:2224 stop:2499 length:276 start_codon:yes stop_codon:yes gene_type:complete
MINDLQDMTDNQLHELNNAIIAQLKFNRDRKAAANRAAFQAGDRVQFIGRHGKMIGTIKRVKRKKAIVTVNAIDNIHHGNWDVPLGMLSAA